MWKIILFALPALSALAKTGEIRGSILLDGGVGFPDMPVAVTLLPASIADTKYQPWTRTAVTAPDGSFRLAEVPPGKYRVCPQKSIPGYINPCVWNSTPNTVSLTAAQSLTLPPIHLARSQALEVRIEDPDGLLAVARAPDRGGRNAPSKQNLLLGCFTAAGYYIQARFAGDLGTVRRYILEVPNAGPVSLSVSSTSVQLADSAGLRLDAARGHKLKVDLAFGKAPSPILLRVQGPLPAAK